MAAAPAARLLLLAALVALAGPQGTVALKHPLPTQETAAERASGGAVGNMTAGGEEASRGPPLSPKEWWGLQGTKLWLQFLEAEQTLAKHMEWIEVFKNPRDRDLFFGTIRFDMDKLAKSWHEWAQYVAATPGAFALPQSRLAEGNMTTSRGQGPPLTPAEWWGFQAAKLWFEFAAAETKLSTHMKWAAKAFKDPRDRDLFIGAIRFDMDALTKSWHEWAEYMPTMPKNYP